MGNIQPPSKPQVNRKGGPPIMAGRRRRKAKLEESAATRVPAVTPHKPCLLRLRKLERIQDWTLLQEELIQNCLNLKPGADGKEASKAREEVDLIRGSCMRVARLAEMLTEDRAIVSVSGMPDTYMPVLSIVDRDLLESGCSILTTYQASAVVGVLANENEMTLARIKMDVAPTETYADIGGLEKQINELIEAVELPLTKPDLYEEMGISSPKGVILYGPPGTGKTLLAKAVANKTSATFLRVVGSELIRKTMGEGPKLVRNIFKMAEDLSPTIIFIDEIDAIGEKRGSSNKSDGELEVQRTMLELLTQLDGFDKKVDVKVIMATNRIECLDPALIRPGRIDRKIEIPLPDDPGVKLRIFNIHTKKMTLAEDILPESLLNTNDGMSGADIKAMCSEAGMRALRYRRTQVTYEDFEKAKESVVRKLMEAMPANMYV